MPNWIMCLCPPPLDRDAVAEIDEQIIVSDDPWAVSDDSDDDVPLANIITAMVPVSPPRKASSSWEYQVHQSMGVEFMDC